MKENNRFVSFIVALTMILSSLSGLTINASAEGEPALSDWEFTEQYSEDFSTYSGAQDASVISEKANNAWTWSDATGFTRARGYQIYQNAFNMKWARWAQYNIPSGNTTDVIAFRYTVQTNGTEQYVSIIDSSNVEVVLLDQTAAAGEYKTFTTVIDTTTKKIYTFKPDGTTDTSKSYTGDSIQAIRFGNTANTNDWIFLMDDFAYMTENNVAEPITIEKTKPINGSFTVDQSAIAGNEVEITDIVPATYYELGQITVTGKTSEENIAVTNNKFTMPNEEVTVTVTFKAINYTVTATVNTGVKSVTLTGTGSNTQTKTVNGYETTLTFSVPHDTYTIFAAYDEGYEEDSITLSSIEVTDNNGKFTVTAKQSSDPAIDGTVTISGKAKVDETLTAIANITNGSGAVSYQWQAKDENEADTEYQNIANATESTYTIEKAYAGKVIRVVVTKVGTSGSKESDATAVVAPKTYIVKGTVGDGIQSVTLQKGSENTIEGALNSGEITFSDVLEGTYTVIVTKADGYKSASSNPATITVNEENDTANRANAFTASAIAYSNPMITIEAYDTNNGTVTVTGGASSITTGNTTAREDTTITVSVTANAGYEVVLKYKEAGDADYQNVPSNGQITVSTKDILIQAVFNAVTPADPKAKLSYWEAQTLTEKDNNTFANSDDEKDNLNAKIIQEIEGTDAISNWTFESKKSDGSTRADNTRVSANNKGELTITYDGAAIYTRSAETGAYYYKYTISMSEDGTGNNQTVRLTGITNGTLFTSPNAGGSFTTVISPSDSKAYTYDESGDLVSESTITIGSGEKVAGIEFRSANNSNKNIKVSNFSYGLIGDAKEPEPPMLDITLGEWQTKFDNVAYTFEFDTTLTDEVIFGEKGIWVTDGTTGNQGDVWQRADKELTVLQIRNGKSATLTKTPPVDVYYYTYNLYNNGANTVKLEGIADGIIIEFTANKAYTQYTTVVDTVNGKVYTYEGTDTETQPIKVNVIGENEMISGITFASGGGYMYLDNFAYGLTKGETDPDPYNPNGGGSTTDPTPGPTAEPTPEPSDTNSKLSDWDLTEASVTEVFDGKSITDLQADDWRFGNTNAGANFNEKHVIINGSGELEINWYGTATYGKTDENESFYYTYTVKTKDTAGMRSVKLSGADNSTMIVSGKEITSSERTFTTVVDVNSKKAYTYDTATGDFVSVVDVQNPSAVNGITFSGGTENVNAGMQVDNVSYGLVNITPPEKPVTIVLTSDSVNEGEKLENNETYEITGEKFTETVIKFTEPYSSKEGKTLLYMTNSIVITSPSNANGNIIVDGTKITALEALTAGTYDISVAVKSEYQGEEYGSETYTVRLVKPEVTDEDISNEYKPVITTETVNGKEITVSTDTASPTEIYKDLELPTETSFANITWTSDNKDILSDNGNVVKRPLEDTTVTLTALIANKYNSGSTVTKQITVVVKGIGNMLDDAIAKAKAAITKVYDEDGDIDITGLSDLHQDIKLYTEYEKNDEYPEYDDVTLLWSSSNNDVLKINGGVAEIYPLTTNEYKITLTINASALGQEKEENIDVTVHLTADNAGDRYAVRCDDLAASNFSDVANYSGNTVSSNISIPTEGMFGSIISWTSSVPMYMSNTGTYTAPASDTKVTLTGIVSKGTVISDKKHAYSFTVKGKNKNQSSGGGGSSSGSTGGSTSSFSVPSANITKPLVTANPSSSDNYNQNTDTEPEGFTDLGNVAWAREAINALADKGIISGRSEHIFDPDANITRAEFATIIVKAFGFEDENANADEFADVSENDWYYSFVAAAYNNGIINGYDNGTFGSSDNITRQDMAVIIYRAAKAAGIEIDEVNEAKNFDDNDFIAAYAREAIDTLVKAGVINGISETEFAPAANATRAQAAKMIYEFVK